MIPATPSGNQRAAAHSRAAATVSRAPKRVVCAVSLTGRRQSAWLHWAAMPIYEYRCPDGRVRALPAHVRRARRGVRGLRQGPVEKVLYPVSVHFKGSGFYTTDYHGRGSRKKSDASKDGGDSASSEKKAESGEKKAAAAD